MKLINIHQLLVTFITGPMQEVEVYLAHRHIHQKLIALVNDPNQLLPLQPPATRWDVTRCGTAWLGTCSSRRGSSSTPRTSRYRQSMAARRLPGWPCPGQMRWARPEERHGSYWPIPSYLFFYFFSNFQVYFSIFKTETRLLCKVHILSCIKKNQGDTVKYENTLLSKIRLDGMG